MDDLLIPDDDVFNKFETLTRYLIDQEVLDCGGNEYYYLEDGKVKKKMYDIIKHFGLLKDKKFDFIDKIHKVVLSGKTITNPDIKALMASKVISSDAKNEKSDVHILLNDPSNPLVGFSVKKTTDATEVNYSLEKILNEIDPRLDELLKESRKNTITKWLGELNEMASRGGLKALKNKDGDGSVVYQDNKSDTLVWTMEKMKPDAWIDTWNANFKDQCKFNVADDQDRQQLVVVQADFFTYEFFRKIFNSSDSKKKNLLRDIMKHCWYKERHVWLEKEGSSAWHGYPDFSETFFNPNNFHYYQVLKSFIHHHSVIIGQIMAESLFGVNTKYPFWKINGETCELLNNKKIASFEFKSDPTKYLNNAKLFFILSIIMEDSLGKKTSSLKSLEVRFKGDQGFGASPQFQSKEIPWD